MNINKIILSLLILLVSANICSSDDGSSDNSSLRAMFQNNKAVIYALNIRTFNANDINGNEIIEYSLGETSGSFINAIDRLDELTSMGINAVHLLPITPVGKMKALGTAGSLYSLSDFTKLNNQLFDSQSDLPLKEQAKKFVEACHARNIKVIVDLPSCGSYDLFVNRPDLFVLNTDGTPYIPSDWVDVRLFKVPDNDELYHSDILFLHKVFVNNMLSIGVDGIRADVATIKPYVFWKELIKYTREKNPDFMFLAEASESWTKPASDRAYFTDYKKLLDAGFDGYYGDFFNLKNWKTVDELNNSIISRQKILKKYLDKKSVIGSFATHDVVSPLLTGGENFSKIIIWLNATLPLNPYYVDGFLQGDDYLYRYANKKAGETYTDDEYYYVHKGQIDIFNFSRKPGSDTEELVKEQKLAMKFRNKYLDVITSGSYVPLKSDNNKIFAFQRILKNKSVVVIINRNLVSSEEVKVKVKKIKKSSKIHFVKGNGSDYLEKSMFFKKLKPAEILVFTVSE